MSTAIDLEPPSFDDEPVENQHATHVAVHMQKVNAAFEAALQPGSDVLVDLNGTIYPGKVSRTISNIPNELAVETPAARFMSRHWKTLLFYIDSRKAVYGTAKLIIPGIDPAPTQTQIQHETPKAEEAKATLDEPEALAREEDVGDQWTEASTLNEKEQEELWYNRD